MVRQHNTLEERIASLETSSDTLVAQVSHLGKRIDSHTRQLHLKIDAIPNSLSSKLASKSEFNSLRWAVRTVLAGLIAVAFSVIQLKTS